MSGGVERSFLWRLMLIGVLTAGAVVLFFVQKGPGVPEAQYHGRTSVHSMEEVNVVVDTLFARYGIREHWVRTWRVEVPNGNFARIERRVFVPSDFISLRFNQDLNTMLSAFGARAIATERSRENTVSMHVIQDALVVQSINFVVKQQLDTLKAVRNDER